MSPLAGEKAQETGMLRCKKCNHPVRVNKGEPIPKCPNCGHDLYDRRSDATSGK